MGFVTPSKLEPGRWETFLSCSHQLHLAEEVVELILVAWDALFPPMKFCKELGQMSSKSSPEGLNHFGDT